MAARILVAFLAVQFCLISREVYATASQQVEDGKGADIWIHPEPETEEPSLETSWLTPVPWEFSKLLSWLKDTSDDIEIAVGGEEVSGGQELQSDSTKKNYLTAILGAMDLSQVKVSAYTAWNLMNNFEWSKGYSGKIRLAYDWYVLIDTEP